MIRYVVVGARLAVIVLIIEAQVDFGESLLAPKHIVDVLLYIWIRPQ